MPRRTALVSTVAAVIAVVAVAPAPGAGVPAQTDWTIVSAKGTTQYTVQGSDGNVSYQGSIQASWQQKPTKQPGVRSVSFPFKSIPRYAAGKTIFWRSPIYGVTGRVSGKVSVQSPDASGSCEFAMPKLPRTFFSGSGANDLFLDSGTAGSDLVTFVNGQDAGGTFIDAPECDSLPLGPPAVTDAARERIKRISLSLVTSQKPGKKVTLGILRTVPVVATGRKVVGQVTEKAKITLTPYRLGA